MPFARQEFEVDIGLRIGKGAGGGCLPATDTGRSTGALDRATCCKLLPLVRMLNQAVVHDMTVLNLAFANVLDLHSTILHYPANSDPSSPRSPAKCHPIQMPSPIDQ